MCSAVCVAMARISFYDNSLIMKSHSNAIFLFGSLDSAWEKIAIRALCMLAQKDPSLRPLW